MSDAAHDRMTVSNFYRWLSGQVEGKFEFVDGQPLIMAGANRRHDRIAATALRLIGNHLDGHRCQPFTSDTYIAIPAGNRRQVDMGIGCGTPEDTSLEADAPSMILEILSPTTRAFDRNDKLEEYKTVSSLEYIVLVDPDYPQVRVYCREMDRSWSTNRLVGLDALLDMPMFDIRLPLSALYPASNSARARRWSSRRLQRPNSPSRLARER